MAKPHVYLCLFTLAAPLFALSGCETVDDVELRALEAELDSELAGQAELDQVDTGEQAPTNTSLSASKKPPVADYFIATRVDLRKCAAPICGGWFVKRVNSDVTRCADGNWRLECHSFDIDLSALGLKADQADKLRKSFGAGQVLVRGGLEPQDIGLGLPANTLIAQEAWLGVTGNEPDGHFSRVDDTGLQCVTFPCAYFTERALNTNLVDSLAGVDLAASGATLAQVAAGNAELDATGLLVAGSHDTVSGPAGTMNQLVASEFYTRVKANTK